jgi:hypothetical protein
MLGVGNLLLCHGVFIVHNDDDNNDHGVRWVNLARALARWRHLGASNEATNTLHWSMCLAPYQPSGMIVAFTINVITFFAS